MRIGPLVDGNGWGPVALAQAGCGSDFDIRERGGISGSTSHLKQVGCAAQVTGDITAYLQVHRWGGLQAEVGVKAGHAMNTVQWYPEAVGETLKFGGW
jgi:hypothetical protein